MLASKSLSFSFSLKVGNNFSFSMESRGEGALSPQKKKKKTTPSALRRNARRREEFLRKKLAPAAEKSEQEVSEKEADSPGKAPTLQHHPSPSPSSERRKVITVGREKEVPTFSQLCSTSGSCKTTILLISCLLSCFATIPPNTGSVHNDHQSPS